MENRKSLVKTEPKLTDNHVVVRVRQPLMGNLNRLFHADQQMIEVYFWIGSLSTDPLFFILKDCHNNYCYPDERIRQGVYNIAQRNNNVNMSRDGDIVFKEFAEFGGTIHNS